MLVVTISPLFQVAAERATELAANTKGICFIRVSRPATTIVYDNNEKFQIGKGKVVKQSADDKVRIARNEPLKRIIT